MSNSRTGCRTKALEWVGVAEERMRAAHGQLNLAANLYASPNTAATIAGVWATLAVTATEP